MTAAIHLTLSLVLLALLLGLLTLIWIKFKIKIVFKVSASLVLISIIITLTPFIFNIYDYIKYDNQEILPPIRPIGSVIEQENTAQYLEELLATNLNPNAFIKHAEEITKQEEIMLPYARVDLIMIDGVISKNNKPPLPEKFWSANTPAGNLKEQLAIQAQLIQKEINSGDPSEELLAKKRIYVLIALGNRYLETCHSMDMMIGIYIMNKTIPILQKNPSLCKIPAIKKELQKTLGFNTNTHVSQYAATIYNAREIERATTLNKGKITNYALNRTLFDKYLRIIEENNNYNTQNEKINQLLKECLFKGQIPTYFTLKFLRLTDESAPTINQDFTTMINQIDELIDKDNTK
jgi:hypothetical protein